MSVAQIGDLFDVGVDCLGSTRDANGTLLLQTGDAVAAEVACDGAEHWQHVGFASRPSLAINGASACQAIAIKTGSADACIATRDLRSQQVYGNLAEGETCVFAAGPNGTGQGCMSLKQDGSITLITSDNNTASGNGVYFKISPTKMQFMAPWGSMTFDATGFHIKTKTGARLDMGALAAPPPLDTLVPSYVKISGGTVTLAGALATAIDSPMVTLGKNATQSILTTAAPNVLPPLAPTITVIATPGGGPVTGMTATTKVLVAP